MTNNSSDDDAYPRRRDLRETRAADTAYPRRRDLRNPPEDDAGEAESADTLSFATVQTVPHPSRTHLPPGSPSLRPTSTRTRPPLSRTAVAARRAQTALAMAFVGLLAAAIAIPAQATTGWSDRPSTSTADQNTQTLVGSGAAEADAKRDEYSVSTAAPPPPSVAVSAESNAFARTSDTFTNNPLSPIQWPFTTGVPISDGFGPRIAPCASCSSDHKGLDMNPGQGTPIQAIADGVVTVAQSSDNGGLGVYAEIDHVVDGQRITSVYAHMLEGSLQLSVGQVVTVGQQVGNVGNTGTSTGAHLHFEIHVDGTPVDPYSWLTARVLP